MCDICRRLTLRGIAIQSAAKISRRNGAMQLTHGVQDILLDCVQGRVLSHAMVPRTALLTMNTSSSVFGQQRSVARLKASLRHCCER